MKTSESIKEISAALCKAQLKIKAAVKDATNPHFRSKYADIASVIEAVREPLNAAGISFLQPVSATSEGVAVETVLLHSSGEWLSETLNLPVSKQDAQGVGSAITYGRRYGLMAMCGVPADDDDGNAAMRKITPTAGTWESLPESDQSRLTDLAQVAKEYIADGDVAAAVKVIDDAALDAEHKIALWTRFDSKQRSAMKKAASDAAMKEGMPA